VNSDIDVRQRLPHDLAWLVGLAVTFFSVKMCVDFRVGVDAHAYWAAYRGELYQHAPTTEDAFLYSPAFLHAIAPIAWLPWPVFAALVMGAAGLTFAYLLAPLGWRWGVPLWLCCTGEILTGNIFWLLALVALFGRRVPSLWVVPLLTKITPGVGLLWFLVRRQWTALAVAAATLVVVVGLSYALAPGLWRDWVDFLLHNAGSSTHSVGSRIVPPPVVRVPMAIVLVAWGARKERPWTLPVGMLLATPVIGLGSFTILAALVRLGYRPEDRRRPTHGALSSTRGPGPAAEHR